MTDLKTLLSTLPLPGDEAQRLLALLPTLDPDWGIRAMVLHGADQLLTEAAAQEAYRDFDRALPEVARFSFMTLGDFHLRFLRLATLLSPGAPLEDAMTKAASLCMSSYLQRSRALRITQMGLDNQLGLYIRTATEMMHQFINFVKTNIQTLDTHHVHVHIEKDPTGVIHFLAVPFYETLFMTFSIKGQARAIRDAHFRSDLIVDLTWSGEPPSLNDLKSELMEMLKNQGGS